MTQFSVSDGVWSELRAHAIEDAPREACGLLAGSRDSSLALLPIRMDNIAEDPILGWKMGSEQLLEALERIRDENQRLVGIYHSHPTSDAALSLSDIQWAWPGLVQVVIGMGRGLVGRAFLVNEGTVQRLELKVLDPACA